RWRTARSRDLHRSLRPIVGEWLDRLLRSGSVPDERDNHTTAAVQRFLDELAGLRGDSPAEPVIRDLLATAVHRLQVLCTSLLFRSYPRLTRPPLNLQADEMLGAVVERLLKAMREVRPATVRQFFALANQHMRWELNEMARRLDEQPVGVELHDGQLPAPASS